METLSRLNKIKGHKVWGFAHFELALKYLSRTGAIQGGGWTCYEIDTTFDTILKVSVFKSALLVKLLNIDLCHGEVYIKNKRQQEESNV